MIKSLFSKKNYSMGIESYGILLAYEYRRWRSKNPGQTVNCGQRTLSGAAVDFILGLQNLSETL